LSLVATYYIDKLTGEISGALPPSAFANSVPKRIQAQNATAGVLSYAEAASQPPSLDLPALQAHLQIAGSLRIQGYVLKIEGDVFRRWKIRTLAYNTVRHLRGNSPRLDFLWMDHWSKGALNTYLAHYPEERLISQAVLDRWMAVSKDVYKWYVDVFKARATPSTAIPRKYRPLVYGLHDLYHTLKVDGKSLDWRAAVSWLNERDTAQKIFVINWDLRQESSAALSLLEMNAS
jgi:hypothetical protein